MSKDRPPPRMLHDPEAALAEAMADAPTFESTTADVLVRVKTFWLDDQSQPEDRHYAWAYHIRIENRRPETVQLRARSWEIIDAHGRVEHVHGDGVVGEQPVLAEGESFEYTSGASLQTPTGFMRGAYHMVVVANGAAFDVRIPCFSLDSPHHSRLVH
ncbi:ApaG protein [Ameyamaea chiangmaiensis NBRC 103196]|uniref:Protein ApaG n=1 Tax=Ameyamaea chiangmaiensis TaxID=442969 RepID=A0A850PDT9_9PROT|nr:Co2+/Mg2+ efflux protein ApaG [Ameyamaea chiangmaiensis]MBS4074802.1 Co2+/Mg2+ efflux protein ApaG [Ameyamaea chiangmaiensis]NVN40640.1 Co2+/Mg2+ efflux protein ApaG [Ameyamaea chiangmaiensis]GBQ62787.1 ApaG protein [Ameyamaea chiangmaiensis NBRC 103196]